MVTEEAIRVREITDEEIKQKTKPKLRKVLNIVWTSFLVVAVLVAIPVTYVDVVYTSVYIDGQSMAPTLNNFDNHRYVEFGLMDERAKTKSSLARGDIIVFNRNGDSEGNPDLLIKRVIALPNESIEIVDNAAGDIINITTATGDTFVLDENYLTVQSTYNTVKATDDGPGTNNVLVLGADEYYLMGDNRANSHDSRILGAIPSARIRGKLILVLGYAEDVIIVKGQSELYKRHYYMMWKWRRY